MSFIFSSQSDYPTASAGLSSPSCRCGSRSRSSLRPEAAGSVEGLNPRGRWSKWFYPLLSWNEAPRTSCFNTSTSEFNIECSKSGTPEIVLQTPLFRRLSQKRTRMQHLYNHTSKANRNIERKCKKRFLSPFWLVSDANFSGLRRNPKPLSSRPSAARGFGSPSDTAGERSEPAWCLVEEWWMGQNWDINEPTKIAKRVWSCF